MGYLLERQIQKNGLLTRGPRKRSLTSRPGISTITILTIDLAVK